MSRAQVSIEFMYVLGMMLLVLTVYSGLLLLKYSELRAQAAQQEFQHAAEALAVEVNTAASSGPGYSRTFFLPERIAGYEYNITYSQEYKAISLESTDYSASRPVNAGKVEIVAWNKGGNQTIENQAGVVIVK